ncbi:uncharacterized protein METZ01_LOCUS375123, partial [marine metagenome]
MIGLRANPAVFGVLVTLAALAVSWRASGTSTSERTPAVALLTL